jgi:hypothetical protein
VRVISQLAACGCPRDCFAPYCFGQYVVLDAGQVLLDFASSVQHVDPVGEMRPGFHLPFTNLRCGLNPDSLPSAFCQDDVVPC